MREIKFKAKSTNNDTWIIGSFVYPNNILQNHLDVYKVIPDTVCQFTGFKDCKGNDVYEFDIVKQEVFNPDCDLDDESTTFIDKISSIQFVNGRFEIKDNEMDVDGTLDWDWEMIEVIGNIHNKLAAQ